MTKNGSVEVLQGTARTGREMNPAGPENAVVPAADILEAVDRYLVLLDMPGAEKDTINVNVHKDVLHIAATVHPRYGEQGTVLFSETDTPGYARSFTLGPGVDLNRVEAAFENGVLRITLHKTDEVKPRQIAIR